MGTGPNFMQSRSGRIAMNALVTVITAFYAAQGVGNILRPSEQYGALIEQIGQGGYYALVGAQIVVCAWASVMFARATLRALREKDE